MSKKNVSEALRRFGESVDIPFIELDDTGMRCIQFTDELMVNIQYNESSDALLLYAHVGTLAEDAPPSLLRMLLEANVFWQETAGATLSVDSSDGEVMLAYQEPAEATTPERFETLLKNFADAAHIWQQTILRESESAASEVESVLPMDEISFRA